MSQTFSNDETDWQGVDIKPVPGSCNIAESGGVYSGLEDRLSLKKNQEKLEELYKNVGKGVVSEKNRLDIIDGNNNIIAYFDHLGLHSINYNEAYAEKLPEIANYAEELQKTVNYDDNEDDRLNIVDKNYNIIAYFDKDGLHSINDKELSGLELFTVGDSLSAPGIWQEVVSEITGCIFDQSKNSKPGSQISTGGTVTFGGSKDSALARILNIKKEGYHPDIIMLENVNDAASFSTDGTISGNIDDPALIINQILEGYLLSDWNTDTASLLDSIPSADRDYGTSLQLLFDKGGKNLKVTGAATSNGNISIKITINGTLQTYNISVTTSDSLEQIATKIYNVSYSGINKSKGADNKSVNFYTSLGNGWNFEFVDTDNTGVTVSITNLIKNLKITHVATTEGDITIRIQNRQMGWLSYNIHVLTTDSISDIVDKIVEYNFTFMTDTKASNDSVDFTPLSPYEWNMEVLVGNTGVTFTLSDINSAPCETPRLFVGENLTTDWVDSSKWTTTVSFYSAWKGLIEFAKNNYPSAELIILMFPRFSIDPSQYTNPNGTFEQEEFNDSDYNLKTNGYFTELKKIASIYNVPVIDIHYNSGITVGNYLEYYPNNNVHPKTVGYQYFGRKIAKELLKLI